MDDHNINCNTCCKRSYTNSRTGLVECAHTLAGIACLPNCICADCLIKSVCLENCDSFFIIIDNYTKSLAKEIKAWSTKYINEI